MTGDVTINGSDAYTTWGINFEDGALSALMTPPSLKPFIENNSRLVHGKRVIAKQPKFEAREIVLPFHIVASSTSDFLSKYADFCSNVLANGTFTLSSRYQSGVLYHLVYVSCTQFRQFDRKVAVFSLKVTEPDPTNRTQEESSNSSD